MTTTLLTAPEVAERLRVRPSRVYELLRSGVLPSVRVGRQVRVDPAELELFIRGGGQSLPGGWKAKKDDNA